MRRLLDAAMEVFATRGYHAARVDDIVRAARTSHGTFYLYFANKEDLLRALAAEAGEVVTALDTGLGPVGPDDSGWWELRRWMEQFSTAWRRYAPVLRAWTDVVVTDVQLAEQAHIAAGGVMATLADRMEKAGPLPGIDPPTAAEAVIAMVDRFHYLRQFSEEPIDAAALDTLTTIVHRGLFGGGDPPVAGRSRTKRPASRAATTGRPGGTTTRRRTTPTATPPTSSTGATPSRSATRTPTTARTPTKTRTRTAARTSTATRTPTTSASTPGRAAAAARAGASAPTDASVRAATTARSAPTLEDPAARGRAAQSPAAHGPAATDELDRPAGRPAGRPATTGRGPSSSSPPPEPSRRSTAARRTSSTRPRRAPGPGRGT
jgi:AcrR family transcriptional regulator